MRTHGDIPEGDRIILDQLIQMEIWFHEKKSEIRPPLRSKGLLCMAHDYYAMAMEEEGERLISMAVEATPDYFKDEIYDQMEKDGDFCRLVHQLESTDAMPLITAFGYKG